MIFPKRLLLPLLAGAPCALTANGFRLVSQDAFAAARGEAFAATADNPSAIHYNPAGLTQVDGLQARMGIYALNFQPTFSPPAGAANANQSYHIENDDARVPQLYYSWKDPEKPVAFGLGVYAPHGAGVTWPRDTGFRSVAIEGELTYLRVNPVVAVEILPGLSLGAGVMIDKADIVSEQGLLRGERPANSFRFEGEDDRSMGYNLGVLWQINDQFSVGGTFRSGMTMLFEGKTDFELQRNIQPTTIPAEAEYHFPYTAVLGLSYRPTEKWNIEVNADFSNWSSIDTVTIRQERKPRSPVQQDIPVNLGFEDSWIFKLGVTRYFENGWDLSAGCALNENSVPDEYYTPLVADLDRHLFTIGIGKDWSRFRFDLTYQFGYGSDREVTGSKPASTPARNTGQTADGTYGFISNAVLFSAGMKF